MRISIDEINLALITTSYKRAQQLAIKEFFEYLQKPLTFTTNQGGVYV